MNLPLAKRLLGLSFGLIATLTLAKFFWPSPPEARAVNSASRPPTWPQIIPGSPVIGVGQNIAPTADPSPATAHLKDLTGEAAKAELRKNGQYESLGESLTAARHAVEKIDPAGSHSRGAEFFAANPKQQLRAWFSNDGVELASGLQQKENKEHTEPWNVVLRLHQIGRAGSMETISAGTATSEGSRVEVSHPGGAVTQWFENRKDGLEQGFTLHQRPEGDSGEITLNLAVEGTLRVAEMDATESLRFTDSTGPMSSTTKA